ncbi:hypothetical protein A1O3_06644 [Capronia epimyces CBS 606.96]|uniref:Pseudouridine synthase I TruA alpha/beta domain-containing protein n=1 Tax=Capronia epimyces CBS 606.96 TaxID=1182542 RepID=W9YKR4_9EURO|nr:uncharacterized protein A1O3_06644 [Capronia epimyces CBS 606.96]EXJ82829.1 hypothetical protein A1O3_06644 [Capronia epimyces CBS 606.96]
MSDESYVPSPSADYASCSTAELIERISALERQLRAQTARVAALSGRATDTDTSLSRDETRSIRADDETEPSGAGAGAVGTQALGNYARRRSRSRSRSQSPSRRARPFDPSLYSTRHIALKFAYLGGRYNGYEHANGNVLPQPTIEEVLWKALRKTRLISPPVAEGADQSMDVVWDRHARLARYTDGKSGGRDEARGKVRLDLNWEGCQYSKCGRTDKGVSAFGQVIGIRVRSNRPIDTEKKQEEEEKEEEEEEHTHIAGQVSTRPRPSLSSRPENGADDGARSITSPENGGDDGARSIASTEWEDAMPSIDVDDLDADLDSYTKPFDPIRDELSYVTILNSILPPDIRVLAWCPDPPANFDARFSCRERRYKYFFTNPAFSPTPGPKGMRDADGKPARLREGWLDVEKMREAAKKLEGLHDFRNLCKIDASKQMPNCERRITFADVVEWEDTGKIFSIHPGLNESARRGESNIGSVFGAGLNLGAVLNNGQAPPSLTGPKVYAFCVNGSAFLWHQVRCMVAVLFLVGQGLEEPSVVDELLDVDKTPGRPMYEMADDKPLVLWDCIFPDTDDKDDKVGVMTDSLDWVYTGDQASHPPVNGKSDGKFGVGGVVEELWRQWREAKIQELLAGSLLDLVIGQGDGTALHRLAQGHVEDISRRSRKVFDGDNNARIAGRYVPLMKKPKMDTLHVQNAKWLTIRKARSEARSQTQTQATEATATDVEGQ